MQLYLLVFMLEKIVENWKWRKARATTASFYSYSLGSLHFSIVFHSSIPRQPQTTTPLITSLFLTCQLRSSLCSARSSTRRISSCQIEGEGYWTGRAGVGAEEQVESLAFTGDRVRCVDTTPSIWTFILPIYVSLLTRLRGGTIFFPFLLRFYSKLSVRDCFLSLSA